ncbi:unnamed protein product [Allacma fusca]|uniref:Hormone receptor 4 n=1 Tax=Allacma fusca TaxID=39272 RepID=A0A8J2PIM1_9HEXA|nr:unnamed protein product [Allacma fusca]
MRGIIALPMLSVIDSNVIEIESKGALQNGMSLFQDLKLKRRKVDSRCSSDGESIGTSDSTSSLSPDASSQTQSEGSPKEKDRCITPEELVPPMSSKQTFPQQFFFMMKPDGRSKVAYDSFLNNNNNNNKHTNGVIKLTSNLNGIPENVSVKSEPVEVMENGKRDRSPGSPDKTTTTIENGSSTSPRTNGHSSDTESTASHSSGVSSGESNVSIKREKSEDKYFSNKNDDKDMDLSMSNKDLDRSKFSPPLSRPASTSPPGKVESTLIITKQSKDVINGGSRIPSPPSSHTQNHDHNNGIQQQQQQHPPPPNHHHPTHNHLHARLTGQDLTPRPMNVPSPMVHVEIRNLPEKPDPISVVTSTSLSFHHHSMYRINGVRPEVISGGAVTPATNSSNNNSSNGQVGNHSSSNSPTGSVPVQSRKSPPLSNHSRSPNSSPSNSSSSGSIINGMHSPGTTIVAGGSLGMVNSSSVSSNHHHHVNLNRTPTVIMGEAGGVRTMLWSQPGQTLPPQVDLGAPPPMTNGHGMSNGYPPQNPIPPHSNNNNSNINNNNNNNNNNPPPNHQKGTLSMERLWASEALNLSTSPNGNSNSSNGNHLNGHGNQNGVSVPPLNHITNGHGSGSGGNAHQTNPDDDDYEQPMICMICEDRATGLHYGIITCEGCKGFFKRTVQNRRVYTCVADGTCEITKAQRNRCQYCRFKKCIEQGMVLQAVREDRMPGGRNSGAVYNLYKVPVKYRKHKKGNRVAAGKGEKAPPPQTQPPPPVLNGNILKNALTSPNEGAHFRQQMPFDQAAAMITHLVQCDNFHDIAALQNWDELLEARGDLSDKLCQMGDSIVYRLVQWTKRLPFYQELPVDVHTRVLTHKWHELLVLTTSAWQAMHTPGPPPNMSAEEETTESLQVLQRCLQAMMGRSLTVEQLRQDVGQMVERLTYLTRAFRRMGVRIEEYVCLKVITMLQTTGTRSPEVGVIQERYIKCLRTFVETTCNGHPNRLNDLLRTLHEVQAAAALLLESKMFYVPFLLNSALLQR